MGRRWNRNHSPHNHWRGIRMEPYRGPAGGCRRKRPLGFLSDGLGPKAVSKSCPKYGGIESIPVDSRGPDPAPNWGMFQKNPAMTPVCPIDVPVLRIRRSGVQLPPGAQQVAGISRKGTVSMVSLASANTRSITGLQGLVTGIELRFSTLGRDLRLPRGSDHSGGRRHARPSLSLCAPSRGYL